jgi:hypothetical protein
MSKKRSMIVIVMPIHNIGHKIGEEHKLSILSKLSISIKTQSVQQLVSVFCYYKCVKSFTSMFAYSW